MRKIGEITALIAGNSLLIVGAGVIATGSVLGLAPALILGLPFVAVGGALMVNAFKEYRTEPLKELIEFGANFVR